MKTLNLKTILIWIIANQKISCSLLNKHFPTPSARRNAIRESEMSFYEEPEDEEAIPGYAHKPWDRKQFFSDYPVFADADVDMMTSDNFSQMEIQCGQLRSLAASDKNAWLKNIRAALITQIGNGNIKSLMKIYPHLLEWANNLIREKADESYDWLMEKKLGAAICPRHSQDLGQAGSIAAKFHEGEQGPKVVINEISQQYERRTPVSYGQLTRMIWEDCKMASGEIKIPQLTKPGACSIPSHLRIEQMQKFMGISLGQAQILAKIYRILELGYADVAVRKIGKGDNRMTLNNHIRKFVKEGKGQPWDIIVAPGKSLLGLAQDIKALILEPQEDPEWAKEDHFIPGNIGVTYTKGELAEYVEEFIAYESEDEDGFGKSSDEATNVWMSMNGEHYSIIRDDEDRERQFDQANPVGMYTYNNVSTIPAADHLKGGNVKLYLKLLDRLSARKLTGRAMKASNAWVKKHGTWSQKTMWQKEMHRMTA